MTVRRLLTTAVLALLLGGCQATGWPDAEDDGPAAGLFSGPHADLVATAKASFRAANFGLAEETYRDVLRRDGENAEAWLGLAAAYDRLGRYDLADKAYERALALTGRRAEVLNNLGYSYYLRGDLKRARGTFEEAARLAPDNPVVKANLALVAGRRGA
jgi:Flp pilus assembly protein TadD